MNNIVLPYRYPFRVVIFSAVVLCSLVYSCLFLPQYFLASKELKGGHNAYLNKQYSEAIRLYELVLAKAPNSKEAKISIAEAYFATGKPSEMEKAISYLHGIDIYETDWQRLTKSMPKEYQQYFEKFKR